MDDHDLLIRVDENVKNLAIEMKNLKDDTIGRVSRVEVSKLDRDDFEDFKQTLALEMAKEYANIKTADEVLNKSLKELKDDHETRMRALERFVYIAIGVITVVDLIGIPLFLKFFIKL